MIKLLIVLLTLSNVFTTGVLERDEDPISTVEKSGELYISVYDANDQRFIYGYQSAEKMYPASMTKIMTALVAMDKINDLDEVISISEEALVGLKEQNASVIGFSKGQKVSYRDLLAGVILSSGADACNQLALSLYGDTDSMVDAMNTKAKKFGLKNTHFANTTGLHDDNHFTTANDMVMIMEKALQNETIRDLLTRDYYRMDAADLTIYSTLREKEAALGFTTTMISGGKTGYTLEAGLCLASFSEINGEYLISVVGKEKVESDDLTDAVLVSTQIYDFIYDEFARETVIDIGEDMFEYSIDFARNETIQYVADKNYTYLIPKDWDTSEIDFSYVVLEDLQAPLDKGEIIAKLELSYKGETFHVQKIELQENVERIWWKYQLHRLLNMIYTWKFAIIGIISVLILIFIKKKKEI